MNMDIDDLRDVLNELESEGLDGEEMLAFAKRARTRRRLNTLGGVAAAVVAAVGVGIAVPHLPHLSPDPGLTASPSPHTPSTVRTASSAPVTTASPTRTPSPSLTPTSHPTSTPTGAPTGSDPTATGSSNPSATSTGVPGAITKLCTPRRKVELTWTERMLTSQGNLSVEREGNQITVNTKPIHTITDGSEVVASGTDGRHVVFLTTVGPNRGGEPGMRLYAWDADDSQTSISQARLISDSYEFNGDLQVRDGHALFTTGGEEGDVAVQLLNLSTGKVTTVHRGEYGPPSLLDDGRYLVPVPAPVGMKDSGTAPRRPTLPDGRQVTMYSPYFTNGTSWVFSDGNPGEGDVNVKVWSPTMPEPITVFRGRPDVFLSGAGTNYALVWERDKAFHLVDLRTGGHQKLPSSPTGPFYTLTSGDVLLRNVGETHSGTGPQGWLDLSEQKLEC